MRSSTGASGALEAAEEVLTKAPIPDRLRERHRGEIDFQRAVGHLLDGEPDLARTAADAAVKKWAVTGHPEQTKVSLANSISGDGSAFVAAASLAADEPESWLATLIAITLMPEQLNAEDTQAVKTLLTGHLKGKAPIARIPTVTPSLPASKH